jgi:hypothetical protein
MQTICLSEVSSDAPFDSIAMVIVSSPSQWLSQAALC